MKKILMVTSIMLCLLCTTAYANSSWHWVSQTRPYDVLPIAIIVTLLVEIIGTIRFAGTNKIKSILVILIGNLVSFLTPYLLALNSWYGFENTLNHTPFYNIGIFYFIMTLMVEFPIVYFGLHNNCTTRKRLMSVIVLTNIITTAFTCLLERVLCHGMW